MRSATTASSAGPSGDGGAPPSGGGADHLQQAQQQQQQQFAFSAEEAQSGKAGARTTLMIRNIPNKYTQPMLLALLEKELKETFDFFYLPTDSKNKCNLGYAFINFIEAADTVPFHKAFQGRTWDDFNSKKVCEVTFARVQGRKALLEHFHKPSHAQPGTPPDGGGVAAAAADGAAADARGQQHGPASPASPSYKASASAKRPWVAQSFLDDVGLGAWPS